MEMLTVLGIAAGGLSLAGNFYALARYGFRVDELWRAKEDTGDHGERLAVLEAQVLAILQYNYRRGEAEARSKRIIRDR